MAMFEIHAVDEQIKALPTVSTASGSVATFDTDLTENLVEVKCQIVAQQGGSGTPSPDNVRPITVYNSLTLGQDANYDKFLDFNQLVQNGNFVDTSKWANNNASIAVSNNEATITKDSANQNVFALRQENMPNRENHKILVMFDCKNNGETALLSGIRVRYPFLSSTIAITSEYKRIAVIGISSNSTTFAIQEFLNSATTSTDYSFKVKNINLIDLTQCFGSTIADEIYQMEQQTAGSGVAYVRNLLSNDYYDYTASTIETLGTANNDGTGNTYNIPFGQTVANGVLDITTGKCVIDLIEFSFNSALYYGTYGDYNANLYYVEIPNYNTIPVKMFVNDSYTSYLKSNIFKSISVSSASGMLNNEMRTQASTPPRYLYFRADDFADLTALNTFLSGTPLQVVAELATPQEIQLDSITLQALLNENNIWCDTGDTEVKYLLTVGKKIA